jgi:Nucleotidyl transferase AbiEii toxin, Type IV TA system
VDHVHERLADLGLQAAGRYGFALAGGYAVQAHGFLTRPSDDVDLFTAWERRDDFDVAVTAIVNIYQANGYLVEIIQHFDTFARLTVSDPDLPDTSRKVELAANWRAQPPIMMDIGPVLHPDDVVAGKMSALYTRAEPRDFLDIDAVIVSGTYTRERLCELAHGADAGFDRRVLAEVLAVMERYPDRRFTAYGAAPEELDALRGRYRTWRAELLAPAAPPAPDQPT